MASRCIEALNELDDISEKVFFKYSKSRLKAEINGRVKASKSRAERSSSMDQTFTVLRKGSRYSSHSHHSNLSRVVSSNPSKARSTKSAILSKMSPGETQRKRAQATSCKSRTSGTTSKANTGTTDVDDAFVPRNVRSPSVYGKHTPGEEEPKPMKWFNFDEGSSKGVIDSFACDHLKGKALCYAVDAKQSKSVPKLLRHRLEVRIGRNGEVRSEDCETKEENPSVSKMNHGSKKIRPAPLSWEEQLNWENARIMSPRPPPPDKSKDQGLCETHAVIFNPMPYHSNAPSCETSSNAKQTAVYRMHLGRRLLVSDRGNLTCGGKCITSVEIGRSEVEERKAPEGAVLKRTKTEDSDVDRMDMSTTIQNIENIYRRNSAGPSTGIEETVGNLGETMVENPHSPLGENNSEINDILLSQEPGNADKINKRVSFKDQTDLKTLDKLLVRGVTHLKERPSSSNERLQTPSGHWLIDRPKRPSTAPPCSQRVLTRGHEARESRLTPIRVPTSQHEVLSEVDDSDAVECQNSDEDEGDTQVESGQESPDTKTRDPLTVRVSVACKSAPTSRVALSETTSFPRSQSSLTSGTNKNKYVPPEPIVRLADSSMELPPNLPPAQALVALRKKIREDLAKETADLQLDIQHLYLKHHGANI